MLVHLYRQMQLTSMEYDQANTTKNDPLLQDISAYQRLVGKLLYVTITRPGINYDVQTSRQFMQRTKRPHWYVALRVVRYLKGALGHGVLVASGHTKELTCWCDLDWATCL